LRAEAQSSLAPWPATGFSSGTQGRRCHAASRASGRRRAQQLRTVRSGRPRATAQCRAQQLGDAPARRTVRRTVRLAWPRATAVSPGI